MTELDFQFLARPEPFAIISGFSQAGGVFLASWGEIVFGGLDVTENEVAKQIVDAAYRVHTSLAPDLLESAYEAVLALRVGEARPAHGPAASGFHRLYIKAPGLRWDSGQT